MSVPRNLLPYLSESLWYREYSREILQTVSLIPSALGKVTHKYSYQTNVLFYGEFHRLHGHPIPEFNNHPEEPPYSIRSFSSPCSGAPWDWEHLVLIPNIMTFPAPEFLLNHSQPFLLQANFPGLLSLLQSLMCQVPSSLLWIHEELLCPSLDLDPVLTRGPHRAFTGPPFHISAHPLQFSNSFKEEALFISGEETFFPSTCFPSLSPGEEQRRLSSQGVKWQTAVVSASSGHTIPEGPEGQGKHVEPQAVHVARRRRWPTLIKHRLPDVPLGLAC